MIVLGLVWHFDSLERNAASAGIRSTSQQSATDQSDEAPEGRRAGTVVAESEAALRAQLEFLSRQVGDLRVQVEQAERAALRANRAFLEAQGKLDSALKPLEREMFSSALRAAVESDHTVVTGGYQVPGGGIEYTLFKPTLMMEEGKQVIMLEGKVMRVQREQVDSLGLSTLQTNADNTLQHGEVWSPAEAGRFDSKIKTFGSGIDILSSPRVVLSNGQEAQIEIGNYKAILKATVPEKGGAIQLDLRTEQRKAGESDSP